MVQKTASRNQANLFYGADVGVFGRVSRKLSGRLKRC